MSCFPLLVYMPYLFLLQLWAELLLQEAKRSGVLPDISNPACHPLNTILICSGLLACLNCWRERGELGAESLSQSSHLDSVSHPRNSLNASEKVSGISPWSTSTVRELNTPVCLIFSLPAAWYCSFLSRKESCSGWSLWKAHRYYKSLSAFRDRN